MGPSVHKIPKKPIPFDPMFKDKVKNKDKDKVAGTSESGFLKFEK